MTVLDFENDFTRTSLGKIAERCVAARSAPPTCPRTWPALALRRAFALLTAGAVPFLGDVWTAINEAGLKVTNARSARLTATDAAALFDVVPGGVCDGLSVALEVVGPDAVQQWDTILGTVAATLPAHAGAALVGAASAAESERCLDAFFGDGYRGRAGGALPKFGDTTVTGFKATAAAAAGGGGGASALPAPSARAVTAAMDDLVTSVVVLPHAVAKGQAGPLLRDLGRALAATHDGGDAAGPLTLTALQMFDLELVTAEEFLEVYKHVVPEFGDMAAELSDGLMLALEVRGRDAVQRVRRIVGPRDVDIAKQIRPDTLRAKYGVSTVKNALHCTDLPEDGASESEYFFSVLQQQ